MSSDAYKYRRGITKSCVFVRGNVDPSKATGEGRVSWGSLTSG